MRSGESRPSLLGWVVLAILAAASILPAQPFPAESLAALLGGYSADEKLGFVALVARGEEVVFHQAYGEAHRKPPRPLELDSAFDIGSISKTFTAAAVYRLAGAGRIDLDGTVGDYFEAAPEDKAPITIRQLLNHLSGLVQYHDRRGDFEVMSRDQALARIFSSELRDRPGAGYAYSNAGYTLLAILVEQVAETPFRTYLKEEFFLPLGMKQTGFYGDTGVWPEARVATGYGDRKRGKNSPWHWRQDDLWAVVGSGGIVSTAGDLLLWARAREKLFPEPRPPADLGPERRASSGWYLARRDHTGLQVFHGGAVDMGFIGMLRIYPEHDTTLILLSNTFRAGKPHVRTHLDEIEDLVFAP